MAVAYGAVAFVVAQVSDVLFRALELPDWSLTLVVVLALAGFPFAILFAWIFDVGPDGLERTGPAAPEGEDTPAPAGPQASPAGPQASPASGRLPLWAFASVLALVFVGIGLALRGGMGASQAAASTTEAEERALVVLPVRTGGGGADDDGIVDLVGEEVQARLSRVPGVRVTSWTSALSYRESGKRVGEIAEELGVSHVVEITAQRVDGRLRVSAGLVDAATDRSLWSERYDRQAEDLFGIQGEITGAIVRALELQLTPEEGRRLATPGTTSLEAYELARQGRRVWMAQDAEGYDDLHAADIASAELFRRALALDPGYAVPHAGLARYFLFADAFPFEVRMDSAAFHARRAMELAPHLPDGYVALAWMHRQRGFRDLAALQLRRALELDPNHVDALNALAGHYLSRLQVSDAAGLSRRALQVAPGEFPPYSLHVRIHSLLGDLEGAMYWVRRSAEVAPNPLLIPCAAMEAAIDRRDLDEVRARIGEVAEAAAGSTFGWPCLFEGGLALGNLPEALGWAERMEAAVPPGDAHDSGRISAHLSTLLVLRLLGDEAVLEDRLGFAEATVARARARCSGRCLTWSLATILSMRGRDDEAVAVLQAGLDDGWIRAYPSEGNLDRDFPTLRDHPGFQALMAEVRAHLDREREAVLRDS